MKLLIALVLLVLFCVTPGCGNVSFDPTQYFENQKDHRAFLQEEVEILNQKNIDK